MDLAFCCCGCSYNIACDNIKTVSANCDFVCVLECHKIVFHGRNHFSTVEILENRRHKYTGLFRAFCNIIQVIDNDPSVQVNGDLSAIWIVGWRYILSFNEGYLRDCVICIAQPTMESNRLNYTNRHNKHGDDCQNKNKNFMFHFEKILSVINIIVFCFPPKKAIP